MVTPTRQPCPFCLKSNRFWRDDDDGRQESEDVADSSNCDMKPVLPTPESIKGGPLALRNISKYLKTGTNDDYDLESLGLGLCDKCSKLGEEFTMLFVALQVAKMRLNECARKLKEVLSQDNRQHQLSQRGSDGNYSNGDEFVHIMNWRERTALKFSQMLKKQPPHLELHPVLLPAPATPTMLKSSPPVSPCSEPDSISVNLFSVEMDFEGASDTEFASNPPTPSIPPIETPSTKPPPVKAKKNPRDTIKTKIDKKGWEGYVECDICHKSLQEKNLKGHKLLHEEDEDKRMTPCDKCGKKVSKLSLGYHKLYVCPAAPKLYNPNRRVQCELCGIIVHRASYQCHKRTKGCILARKETNSELSGGSPKNEDLVYQKVKRPSHVELGPTHNPNRKVGCELCGKVVHRANYQSHKRTKGCIRARKASKPSEVERKSRRKEVIKSGTYCELSEGSTESDDDLVSQNLKRQPPHLELETNSKRYNPNRKVECDLCGKFVHVASYQSHKRTKVCIRARKAPKLSEVKLKSRRKQVNKSGTNWELSGDSPESDDLVSENPKRQPPHLEPEAVSIPEPMPGSPTLGSTPPSPLSEADSLCVDPSFLQLNFEDAFDIEPASNPPTPPPPSDPPLPKSPPPPVINTETVTMATETKTDIPRYSNCLWMAEYTECEICQKRLRRRNLKAHNLIHEEEKYNRTILEKGQPPDPELEPIFKPFTPRRMECDLCGKVVLKRSYQSHIRTKACIQARKGPKPPEVAPKSRRKRVNKSGTNCELNGESPESDDLVSQKPKRQPPRLEAEPVSIAKPMPGPSTLGSAPPSPHSEADSLGVDPSFPHLDFEDAADTEPASNPPPSTSPPASGPPLKKSRTRRVIKTENVIIGMKTKKPLPQYRLRPAYLWFDEYVECDICQKRLRRRNLKPHKLTHEEDENKRNTVCDKCGKQVKKTTFRYHKMYRCPEATERYDSDRRVQCELCGKIVLKAAYHGHKTNPRLHPGLQGAEGAPS